MLKVHWLNLFAKFSVTERMAGLASVYWSKGWWKWCQLEL